MPKKADDSRRRIVNFTLLMVPYFQYKNSWASTAIKIKLTIIHLSNEVKFIAKKSLSEEITRNIDTTEMLRFLPVHFESFKNI